MNFSQQDIEQIKNHGLDLDEVNNQIEKFKSGFPYVNIVKPATTNDGVIECDETNCEKYIKKYDEYAKSHNILKFVPASGAATRMFKALFDFISSKTPNKTSQQTISNIEKFAFYDELKTYIDKNSSDIDIIDFSSRYMS